MLPYRVLKVVKILERDGGDNNKEIDWEVCVFCVGSEFQIFGIFGLVGGVAGGVSHDCLDLISSLASQPSPSSDRAQPLLISVDAVWSGTGFEIASPAVRPVASFIQAATTVTFQPCHIPSSARSGPKCFCSVSPTRLVVGDPSLKGMRMSRRG